MTDPLTEFKAPARAWFESLRDEICAAFEAIEADYARTHGLGAPALFERQAWRREGGGGGVMAIMRGRVFEKVGVNVSTVHGAFSEPFRQEIPGAGDDPRFWASGVSLVAHLCSPHVPAAHMNTRHIVTSKAWFGGGADLNPIIPDDRDTADFHAAFKDACDDHGPDSHDRFKAWCDEYFLVRHRGEPRGVGGIFFDHLEGDLDRHFTLVRAVGRAFLAVYPRLVRRHMDRPWTEAERRHQLMRRGRYVEYNLLYDRGTRFGLMTGGNVEAILMSLPPLVSWP